MTIDPTNASPADSEGSLPGDETPDQEPSKHIDEGLGDALQFARFVPMLAARGARVVLVVQDGLVALLNGRTDTFDVSDALTDFVETASLVSCLDLVITVCTGVAHLSATMARPTWVMLPYVADWRWLDNRDDSPWYPTVRLFRQGETRDFADVVTRIRAELAALLSRS